MIAEQIKNWRNCLINSCLMRQNKFSPQLISVYYVENLLIILQTLYIDMLSLTSNIKNNNWKRQNYK